MRKCIYGNTCKYIQYYNLHSWTYFQSLVFITFLLPISARKNRCQDPAFPRDNWSMNVFSIIWLYRDVFGACQSLSSRKKGILVVRNSKLVFPKALEKCIQCRVQGKWLKPFFHHRCSQKQLLLEKYPLHDQFLFMASQVDLIFSSLPEHIERPKKAGGFTLEILNLLCLWNSSSLKVTTKKEQMKN